jgi:hypothetical protein
VAGSVPEEEGVAEVLADEEIEIAITIGIREGRFGDPANIGDPEGIGSGGGVGRSGGR